MDSMYTFAESYALYDEPGTSIPPTIDPDLEWSSLNGAYDHALNHDSFEDLFGFDVRTLDDLVSPNHQNIEDSTLQAFQEDKTPTSGGELSSVKDELDVVDPSGLSLKETPQAFNEILEGAQKRTLNELVGDFPAQDVSESIYCVSTVSPAMTVLTSSQTALVDQALAPFATHEWPTAQDKALCPGSAPVAEHNPDSSDTPPSASPARMNPNLTTSQSVQPPPSPGSEDTSGESFIYSSVISGSSSSTHVFADSSNTLAASKSNYPTDKHGRHDSADAEYYTDLVGVQRRARRSGRGEKPHKQRRFKCELGCDFYAYSKNDITRHYDSLIHKRPSYLCPIDKCGRWLTRSDALKRHIKNFHSENVEGRTRARSNCNGGWSGKAQRLYPSIAQVDRY